MDIKLQLREIRRFGEEVKGGLAAMAWAMLELAQAGRRLDGDLVLLNA